MESSEEDTHNHMHVVLFVKSGIGFDFIKNKPCRVVVEFHKSVLASDPITLSSAPNFGCCFSWRLHDDLWGRLYRHEKSLTIRFQVQESDEEEQTIGYAMINVASAQCDAEADSDLYERIELAGVTLPSQTDVKPEVLMLLTVQTVFCVNSDERFYSAELTYDPLEGSDELSDELSDDLSSSDSKQGPSGLEQRKRAPMKLDLSLFEGLFPAVRDRDQPSEHSSSSGIKRSDDPDTSPKESTEVEEELEGSIPESIKDSEIEDVGEWEEDIAAQQPDLPSASSENVPIPSSQYSALLELTTKWLQKRLLQESTGSPSQTVSVGHESHMSKFPSSHDESKEYEYEGSQKYEDNQSARKSRHSSAKSSSSSYSKDYKTEKKQETSELLPAVNLPSEEGLSSRTKARDTSQTSDISQQESTEVEELEGSISISESRKDPEIEDVGEWEDDIAAQQPDLPNASSENDPILSSQYSSCVELTTEWLGKSSSQASIGRPSQTHGLGLIISPERVKYRPSLSTVSEDHESKYDESHVSKFPSSYGESKEYEYEGSQKSEDSRPARKSRHSSAKSSSSSYSKDYKTEKKQETSELPPIVHQRSEKDLSSRTKAKDTRQTLDISQKESTEVEEGLQKSSSPTSISRPSQTGGLGLIISPERVQYRPSLSTVSEDHERQYDESHVSKFPSSYGESKEYEYEGSQKYEDSRPARKSRHSSAKSSSSSYSKDYKTEKKQETTELPPIVHQRSEKDLSSRTKAKDTRQTTDISQKGYQPTEEKVKENISKLEEIGKLAEETVASARSSSSASQVQKSISSLPLSVKVPAPKREPMKPSLPAKFKEKESKFARSPRSPSERPASSVVSPSPKRVPSLPIALEEKKSVSSEGAAKKSATYSISAAQRQTQVTTPKSQQIEPLLVTVSKQKDATSPKRVSSKPSLPASVPARSPSERQTNVSCPRSSATTPSPKRVSSKPSLPTTLEKRESVSGRSPRSSSERQPTISNSTSSITAASPKRVSWKPSLPTTLEKRESVAARSPHTPSQNQSSVSSPRPSSTPFHRRESLKPIVLEEKGSASVKGVAGDKGAIPKTLQRKPGFLSIPKEHKDVDVRKQQTHISSPHTATPKRLQIKSTLLTLPQEDATRISELQIPSSQDDSSDKSDIPSAYYSTSSESYSFKQSDTKAHIKKDCRERPIMRVDPIRIPSSQSEFDFESITETSSLNLLPLFNLLPGERIPEKKPADQKSRLKYGRGGHELTSQSQSSSLSYYEIPKKTAVKRTTTLPATQVVQPTVRKPTRSVAPTHTKAMPKQKSIDLEPTSIKKKTKQTVATDTTYLPVPDYTCDSDQTVLEPTVIVSSPIETNDMSSSSDSTPVVKHKKHLEVDETKSDETPIYPFYEQEMESISEISKIASGQESAHIYKVSIQITNISWAVLPKDTKIYVRFINPGIFNSVRVRNRDLYVPNLDLADVICNMFYLSRPSQLFETVIKSLPLVYMYKEATRKLIMRATIPVQGVLQEPWDEYFQTKAHLIAKDEQVLGMLDIFVKCNDMGVPRKTEVTPLLKSVIEYKQTVNVPMSKNQIMSQICREVCHLFGMEQATKCGCGTVFAKNIKTEEETDNSQTQILISTEGATEQSMELQRLDKEDRPPQHYLTSSDGYDELEAKKTKTQTEAKQITKILKPSFVIVIRRCQGCSKEAEIAYDQKIWKDDDLVFWCKDCSDKQQKQSKDSIEDNIHLTDYVKSIENEYAKYKANTVSKEEYDRLSAAQHNVTTLFLHGQREILQLRKKCQQLSTNLEQTVAKSEQPLALQDDPQSPDDPSTQALLQEIRFLKLKCEVKEKELYEKQKKLFQGTETRTKIQSAPTTSFQKKDRCELCQNPYKTDTPPVEATNVGQSRPFFKSFKTSFRSSSKHEPKLDLPSFSGALEGMCVHQIRDKLENIHSQIAHYFQLRDELMRVNQYAADCPLILNMTDVINKLFIEYNQLSNAL